MIDEPRDEEPEDDLEGAGDEGASAPPEPPSGESHDEGGEVPADNALPNDLTGLTVEQLRGVLRRRGEPTTGSKDELVESLSKSLRSRPPVI